jgi:hypothetical protein
LAKYFSQSCKIPAVLDTGAYCAAMASNYNMRERALEIGMFGMAGLWKYVCSEWQGSGNRYVRNGKALEIGMFGMAGLWK